MLDERIERKKQLLEGRIARGTNGTPTNINNNPVTVKSFYLF